MNLVTFLSTADENNEVALEQARDFWYPEYRLVPATTINQLLVNTKLTSVIKNTADDQDHPAQDACLGIMWSIMGDHPFNFDPSTPAGAGNWAVIDEFINSCFADKPDVVAKLQNLAVAINSICRTTVTPFANITLHEVLVVRDAVEDFKLLESPDGWVSVEVVTECEVHNPRLMAFNPHSEQWVPAGHFRGVGAVGKYVAQVPRNVFGWNLRVDDVYGAFE